MCVHLIDMFGNECAHICLLGTQGPLPWEEGQGPPPNEVSGSMEGEGTPPNEVGGDMNHHVHLSIITFPRHAPVPHNLDQVYRCGLPEFFDSEVGLL